MTGDDKVVWVQGLEVPAGLSGPGPPCLRAVWTGFCCPQEVLGLGGWREVVTQGLMKMGSCEEAAWSGAGERERPGTFPWSRYLSLSRQRHLHMCSLGAIAACAGAPKGGRPACVLFLCLFMAEAWGSGRVSLRERDRETEAETERDTDERQRDRDRGRGRGRETGRERQREGGGKKNKKERVITTSHSL